MVEESLPILVVISSLRERLLMMVVLKHVKEFMTSKGGPLIMIFGGLSTSLTHGLGYFMLIVRPNSFQAHENLLSSS